MKCIDKMVAKYHRDLAKETDACRKDVTELEKTVARDHFVRKGAKIGAVMGFFGGLIYGIATGDSPQEIVGTAILDVPPGMILAAGCAQMVGYLAYLPGYKREVQEK